MSASRWQIMESFSEMLPEYLTKCFKQGIELLAISDTHTHNTVSNLPYTVMSECILETVNERHTFWQISRGAALQVIPAREPFLAYS